MHQAVRTGLWEQVDAKTSEMKQLKKDQNEAEKEHEKAFQEAIVSADTLFGCIHRSGSVLIPLCYSTQCKSTGNTGKVPP